VRIWVSDPHGFLELNALSDRSRARDAAKPTAHGQRAGRCRVTEGRPVGDRAAEGRRLPIRDGCPETRRDRSQPADEDFAIGEVWPVLERRLSVGVGSQELVACAVDAVRGEGRPETGQDAGLPVDQRAVAVEGQRVKGAVVDFGRRRQIGATAAIRDQPLAPPVKFHDARWSVGTR